PRSCQPLLSHPRHRRSHELAQLWPVEILRLAELHVAVYLAGPFHEPAGVWQIGAVCDTKRDMGPLWRDGEAEPFVARGGAGADGGAEARILFVHGHYRIRENGEHRVAGSAGHLADRWTARFERPIHVAVPAEHAERLPRLRGVRLRTGSVAGADPSETCQCG